MKLNFWLIPAEPWRAQLSVLIQALARRFDTAAFLPHLTVYSTTLAAADDPAAILAAITPRFEPLSVKLGGIESSEKFTKSLFAVVKEHSRLAALCDSLRHGCAVGAPYALQPHFSLVYGQLPPERKVEVARGLELPTAVLCNELHAVITPDGNETRRDVESWKTVARARLGHGV